MYCVIVLFCVVLCGAKPQGRGKEQQPGRNQLLTHRSFALSVSPCSRNLTALGHWTDAVSRACAFVVGTIVVPAIHCLSKPSVAKSSVAGVHPPLHSVSVHDDHAHDCRGGLDWCWCQLGVCSNPALGVLFGSAVSVVHWG